MLTFSDFPYCRPQTEHLLQRIKEHTRLLASAHNIGECYYHLIETDMAARVFRSYALLSEAGQTMDTQNAFFAEEERFFGRIKPQFEWLIQQRNSAICNSPFRTELTALLGKEFFAQTEKRSPSQSESILELLDQENALSQQYSEMMSSLTSEFNGKRISMPALGRQMGEAKAEDKPFLNRLHEQALLTIAPQLDDLYDRLLQIRIQIAKRTGFPSYTDYCFSKHARTGYGRKELERFAVQVERAIVPVISDFIARQSETAGRPLLNFEEASCFSADGIQAPSNPIPLFSEIFGSLSPETHVFFTELTERGSFDLSLRDGKLNGAYSNYIPLTGLPFIFETYNATEGAFQTFAHECGHGLHAFLHRGEEIQELISCSSDIAETHAISMEYLIWPQMRKHFPQRAFQKYCLRQLMNSLMLIPYGTAIDAFQAAVYDNPSLSPHERLALWKNLEQRFLPWRRYEPGLFFDQGRAWQKQIHVMKWPFYYIDYVLAQVCALQFWEMDEQDHSEAWKAYLRFLKDSGRYSFSELLQRAGLRSPFEDGTLAVLGKTVSQALERLQAEEASWKFY